MTDRSQTTDEDHTHTDRTDGVGRREFVALGAGASATLLAGCAGDGVVPSTDGSADGTDSQTATGSFRLLISDAPADIADFDRLAVQLSEARVFEAGGADSAEDEEEDDGGNETAVDDETDGNVSDPETDDEQDGSEAEDAEGDDGGEGGEDGADNGEDDGEDDESDDDGNDDGEDDESDDDGNDDGEDDGNDDGEDDENDDGEEDENDDDGNDDDENDDSEDDDGEDDDGDEDDRGFTIIDLDGATVDLTQVIEEDAIAVFDGEVPAGSYEKIELAVSDVRGIVDGGEVDVKLPSEKLQITNGFEVTPDEPVSFVFDINVVKRGPNGYILKPVISGSGVAGRDVEVNEIDDEEADDDSEDGAEDEEAETEGDESSDDGGNDGDAGGADDDGTGNETAGDGS